MGDLAAEVDGEAAPEHARVGVPEDRGFVVVAVGVERGAEGGFVGVVARGRSGRRAGAGAVVDRAEARGGERGEDAGVGGDLFGGALAAA